MVRIVESTTSRRTVAVVCDRCKRRIEANTPEFEAITHINHRFHADSLWEKGARIYADVCESCLKEVISDFCQIEVFGADQGILAHIEPRAYCEDSESRDGVLTNRRSSGSASKNAVSDEIYIARNNSSPDHELVSEKELLGLKPTAIKLMNGDEEAADQWLNTPSSILNGMSPIEYATSKGKKDVLDLIQRLQHGIFS